MAAIKIVSEINWDTTTEMPSVPVTVKQYDKNSRYIVATVTNGGTPVTVDSSAVVAANFKRADGMAKAFKGEVLSDGRIQIPIPYFATKLVGTTNVSVSFYGTDDDRGTTLRISLRVQAAEIDGDEIVEDDEKDILLGLMTEVSEFNSEMSTAESARVTAEKARAAAEEVRVENENTRIANENTRIAAESKRETTVSDLSAECKQKVEDLSAECKQKVEDLSADIQTTMDENSQTVYNGYGISLTTTLAVSDWDSDGEQVISCSGIRSDDCVLISPDDLSEDFYNADLRGIADSEAGTITVKAMNVPTANLAVHIFVARGRTLADE